MPKKWSEVVANPEYQALPDDQKEAARAQYFQEVVAPQVPADQLQAARAEFDADTGPKVSGANVPHASDVPFADGRSPYTEDELHPTEMAPERDRTFGERAKEAGRGAVLAVRSLGRGAAGIPDLIAGPLAYGVNKGLDAAGVDPSNHQLTGTEIFDRGWGALGLPVPETTGERYVDRVGQGLGGAIAGTGVGNLLAGSANRVAAGVGETMASNRALQGVGAVTSGTAAQAAHEADLGPWAEMGAGLAGGLVPSIPAGVAAATRGAFRGGETGRQRVDQAIADFKTAGTTPTVGQATGLGRNQLLEATLGRTPGAAGVIARKAQDQAGEVQAGLDTVASRLSPKAEPGKAGLAIERGITGPAGFIDRFKAKAGELYDQLDRYLPEGTRVPTSATARALDELVEPIAGAPALSRFFINGKVSSIKSALDADTGPNSPLNRSDVAAEVDRLRNVASDANAATAADVARQNAAIDRQNVLRSALGQKPKAYVEPPADISADDDIASLLSRMQDGRLPYEALKKLRTLVGEEISSPSLASDVKSSAWRKLYSGITEDLRGAAQQAGPEAERAWTRANNFFKAGNSRIEALDRVVDKAGGPEAVFNAATSGSRDGAFTIRRVMSSLEPDQQKILSATVLRRLGAATPGTATESGEFSINSFLTNWNRLSPDAKAALFDRYGKTFRDDVDAISRTAGAFRQAGRAGANPSGTAQAATNTAALVGLASAVGTGNYAVAGGIAGGAATANLFARAMTSPRFVRFLSKTTNVPRSQWPSVLAGLEQSADDAGDEDTKKMAQAMRQALKNNP
jgi:hypothetical protein